MNNHRDDLRRLMISVNQMEGLYYLAAKKLGIKENALTFLYALDDGKSHSQKQICEEWFIPRSTINTIVKEYVNAGYITLINENHTKEKKVAITERGRLHAKEVLQTIYHAEQNAMDETLMKFTPDFVEAMDYLVKHLKKEFDRQIIYQHNIREE